MFLVTGMKSYGQVVDYDYINVGSPTCPIPAVLNCGTGTAGPLNPVPGVVYPYTVTVSPDVSTGYIQWFVTDATTTLVNGNGPVAGIMEPNDGTSPYLLAATPALAYNSTSNTSATINISWQSFDGTATPVLLVAYVKGENGCSDNIEVWRIEPTFTFRLEIAGINPDGTVAGPNAAAECVSPVQSAIYDGTNLTMDYGYNYVFFIVSAASFVDSWQPTFAVSSSSTTVTTADITWAYPAQAILPAGIWNAITVPVEAQDPLNAVGDNGECIIVRVLVDHGAVENDVASTVTLTVDGIMYDIANDNYTNPDLADRDNGATPSDPCVVGSNDVEIFNLTPRPNITENNPGAGTFEPKN